MAMGGKNAIVFWNIKGCKIFMLIIKFNDYSNIPESYFKIMVRITKKVVLFLFYDATTLGRRKMSENRI